MTTGDQRPGDEDWLVEGFNLGWAFRLVGVLSLIVLAAGCSALCLLAAWGGGW